MKVYHNASKETYNYGISAVIEATRIHSGWAQGLVRGRVFEHMKGDRVGAAPAVDYGKSLGIPERQLDWIG